MYSRLCILAVSVFLMVASCVERGDDGVMIVQAKQVKVQPAIPTFINKIQVGDYAAFAPPGPERLPDVPENLFEVIQSGLKLAKQTRMDLDKCVSVSSQTGSKKCLGANYILIAADQTGQLKIIEIYGGKPSVSGYSIDCEISGTCDGTDHGVFVASAPAGWTAVAVRTLVADKKAKDGVRVVIGIPYSDRLNTPEVRQAGLMYLAGVAENVWKEMSVRGVESRYIDDRLVVDFATPDHLMTLVLVEQIMADAAFPDASDADRVKWLSRTFASLGLYRGKSFVHIVSSAGARGLGQGLESTYRDLVEFYPDAGLPADPSEGLVDHHSAMKAMACHTDAQWWGLKMDSKIARRLLADPVERRAFFAGGYNLNVKKLVKAMEGCGKRWRNSCTQLPGQTQRYLVKYDWIYNSLFDESFRIRLEKMNMVARADGPTKTKTPI